jgi:glycosyltransferase involved in cell wall biosynthesis
MIKYSGLKTLIVIPVYNHGKTVAAVTREAAATGMPVLVVDDGSTDNSFSAVKELPCAVLRFTKNRGKGAAILAGARYAAEHGFAAIVTVDADGQHDPSDSLRLTTRAASAAWPLMVIGERGMVEETVPRSSHFGRAFSNFWVRMECGKELPDTQSGLRLYPVQELLQLRLSRVRYDFEIEVLVKSVWAGVGVESVPVSVHYPPGKERISHFHKVVDNYRLTVLHTALVTRRLLPVPHKKIAGTHQQGDRKKNITQAGNPFRALKRLCTENGSPLLLSIAVWLGIFLGALPLIAVHTVVIIYVAHRLHLNKVAAVAASQFCMPPVVPGLCVEIGYYMQHGRFLTDLSWETWGLEAHRRLLDWLLGSLVAGPVLGLTGGVVVYFAARRLQASRLNPSL